MKLGFDVISDLNISATDGFDWSGKATSLYCIVAGNVSSDIRLVGITLSKLSNHYQGVFYIPGSLEFTDCKDISKRVTELNKMCKKIRNVVLLYHNVVVIDGVAVLGVNGWYGNSPNYDNETNANLELQSYEDIVYLQNAIDKLQKHIDVKKIIVASHSVPNEVLFFKEIPEHLADRPELTYSLIADLEKKVTHWVFGSTENS